MKQPNPTIVAHPPSSLARTCASPRISLGETWLTVATFASKPLPLPFQALRPRMKQLVKEVLELIPKRVLHPGAVTGGVKPSASICSGVSTALGGVPSPAPYENVVATCVCVSPTGEFATGCVGANPSLCRRRERMLRRRLLRGTRMLRPHAPASPSPDTRTATARYPPPRADFHARTAHAAPPSTGSSPARTHHSASAREPSSPHSPRTYPHRASPAAPGRSSPSPPP